MKRLSFLGLGICAMVGVTFGPLYAEGSGRLVFHDKSGLTSREMSQETDHFLQKLNTLDLGDVKSDASKEDALSSYGRGSARKLRGQSAPSQIERPGAAIGGNSSYNR